jgi:hypothetical protein
MLHANLSINVLGVFHHAYRATLPDCSLLTTPEQSRSKERKGRLRAVFLFASALNRKIASKPDCQKLKA